jgi:lipopolysaccharide transport system permease protein
VRLARRDLFAGHRRSALGWVWVLLPTLAFVLAWGALRSRGVLESDGFELAYPVHVAAGFVLWQGFVDALFAPVNAVQSSQSALLNTRVPIESLVVSGAIVVVVNLAARFAVVAAVMALSGERPGSTIVLVPLGALTIVALGLAIGCALTPLGALYDDVSRGLGMVVGLWFIATPVVYADRAAMPFNPVTPLLASTRAWLAGGQGHPDFLPVALAVLPVLVVSWLALRVARPHIASCV